jgi:two-component system chemotaxis sensor kinase CheA
MQINMDRFRETFFEEAAEHLQNMEAAILAMEDSPGDRDLLNTIFRGAHSIKGASGTFGLQEVAGFTHFLENLLDKMRAGTIDVTPERLDLLLRSLDVLRGLLASAMGKPGPTPGVQQVLSELTMILGRETTPATTSGQVAGQLATETYHTYRVVFVPHQDILRQGMDPLLLLRDLSHLGKLIDTRADLSRLPRMTDFDPESLYLGWSTSLVSAQTPEQVAEVFAFVQDSSQISISVQHDNHTEIIDHAGTLDANVAETKNVSPARLRVPLAKAADLVRLAANLVHTQSRLVRSASAVVSEARNHRTTVLRCQKPS